MPIISLSLSLGLRTFDTIGCLYTHNMGGASGMAGGGQLPPVPYALPPRCREVTLHVPSQPFLFNCH